MTMQKIALGEVCDFVRGVSFDGDDALDVPKEGYVPILRAGNIGDELYVHDDLVWVPEKRVSKEQYFQVGDIAICMASGSPAVLGKTAQLKEKFVGSVGAFCGIIRPTKAEPNYIAYWLKSSNFMTWRDSQANGVNIQNLRPSEIREIEIPLPPLTEQKRIASLLRRADRLRQLRRTAHDLGDALLQSEFLEMFGDGKWDKTTLGEICSVIRDGTHVTPTYVPSGIPFVTVKNITSGHLDFSVTKFISEEEHKKISKGVKPERGDILVSKDGTIGIPCPVDTDKEFSIFVSVALLKPIREKVNTKFLVYQIGSKVVQDQIEDSIKGIAIRHLHLEDFKRLKIILPPLSKQEEFAGVVARVESLRGRMGESERQVEGLFESLLSGSFGGAS